MRHRMRNVILPAAQSPLIQPSWTKTFEDNFSGSSIDLTKWTTPFFHQTGTNELDWAQGANVSVSNGTCKLTAKQEVTVQGGTTYNYTSGVINTNGIFHQTYGYFEASMKLAAGQGFWPAFWLFCQSGNWPPEVDIMEFLGHQTNIVHQTQWYSSGGNQQRSNAFTGVDFTTGFNNFSLLWTSSYMRWYVNQVQVFEVTQDIPSEDMYMILDFAVGGDWPGPPDGTTVFPSVCEIDYVRAYSLT